jgi:6-phosphogluconolactonase
MNRTLFPLVLLALAIACDDPNNTVKETKESLFFVGTYTENEGFVDGKAEGIYGLSFDPENGTIRETNLMVASTNPSYITLDSENKKIYAVNEKVGKGEKLTAFSIGDSSITALNQVDALGGAPCHIMIDNGYVFTANYVGGNHAVYRIKADGTLGANTQLIQNIGSGPSSRQEGPHAHMITKNPHTSDIITADLGTDEVSFYTFEADEGKLNEKFVLKLDNGSGPRHMDFHKQNDVIYILNELKGSISVAKPSKEGYEVVQTIDATKMGDPGEAGCAAIHMHPNGKYLYASNRGPYNSISQFTVDSEGLLKMIGEVSSGGKAPRDFAIDPSGNFLLAANQNSDNIVVFKINSDTGKLLETETVFSAPTPVCLKFL